MSGSRALALSEARPARAALYGTRAQVAVADGGIQGFFTLASCDTRAGVANYALRIDNDSAFPLQASMTCVRRKGEVVPAYPLDIDVAPRSRCETLLPVRMTEVGYFDRAIVNVSGSELAFSLEAPAPVRQPRRFPYLAAAAAALMLPVVCALWAVAVTPRIAMLAAPTHVFAGAPVDVPYAFGGWAAMQYAFKTADGRQLAAGMLHDPQGTLHFTVPAAAGNAMVLAVNVTGPFGSRHSVQNIIVDTVKPQPAAAKPQQQAPRISAFALKTGDVHAGESVTFAYTTNASAGQIWLIDESGRLWASAPIDPSGQTSLKIPQGAAGHQLRAVMRAKTGSQDAVASLGVTVLPGALVTDAQPQGGAPAQVAAAPAAAVMSISKAAALPGESITLALQGARGDASVVLNDSSGAAIESGDIADGQTAIAFTAPKNPGTYYFVVTVSNGNAQQTLVKTLTVK